MSYIVKSNLNHDGIEYKKGDQINLDGETAKRLAADGVIFAEDEDANADVEAPQPSVNEVVRDGDDVEGKPKVKAGEPVELLKDDDEEEVDGDDVEAPVSAEKHVITEEDLIEFPELTEQGYTVGDEIDELPVKEDNSGDEL